MRKIIFPLCFLCSACVAIVPLKNQYEAQPRVTVISKPCKEVWNHFALLAIDNGYPVKNSDISTGLITVDQTGFNGHGGFETRSGRLANQDAYIVAERPSNVYPNATDKFHFSASWNVLFSRVDSNSTQVRIILYDINASDRDGPLQGKSTGKFETWLIDQLKM